MEIGAKMATQQDQIRKKKTKMDPKKRVFFFKRAQNFELLKQVPESPHQTGSFGVSQHIRTFFSPKVPSCAFCSL